MRVAEWFEAARTTAVERILGHSAARRIGAKFQVPETLERRVLLSNSAIPFATPPIGLLHPVTITGIHPHALTPNTVAPFRPSDIQKAYGIDQISFGGTAGNGAGQTIAIIDAFNDPNIISDVAAFSTQFNLPQFNGTGGPTFSVLNQNGQSSALPANATSSTGAWDSEEALDVEWAHAIAPRANIILFEANSASDMDLFTAARTAAAYAGVSVVSMSFGSAEFSVEALFDNYFVTPTGHQGVTFLASTGDSDAPGEYPAYSPNVVGVGGTSLVLNSDSSYSSESAWGNVSTHTGGGGGVSTYENQPSYQNGNVNGLGGSPLHRTSPDISMLADMSTGVYLYSTWNGGANNGGFYEAGGTSLSCPMWAGLIAIANQERVAAGMTTLDGPSQTLPRIYQAPTADFHDVTTGNNGFAAGADYDLATGIGTPIANLIVPQLAGVNAAATKLAFIVSPSNTTAGSSISPSITIAIEDQNGNILTNDSSNVTISIGANAGGGTLSGTVTVSAVNGIATFSGLSINKTAAGYTLTAADGFLSSATSATFTISPGTSARVVFSHAPGNTTVGAAISPSVTVSVQDAFGNLVTGDTSTVTLTLNSGTFSTGSAAASVSAVNGVATFSNLIINTAGTYAITASDSSLTIAISGNFSVGKATPIVAVADGGGTYNGSSFGAIDASALDSNSSALIAGFGSGALTYVYYAGTLTNGSQIAAATPLSGLPVSAGPYTVVAVYGGSANYSSATSAPVNFSIARRTLHVSATAFDKVYDGATAASVTFNDDRIGGDVFTLSDSIAAFASRNVGPSVAVNISGIAISGNAASNYILSSTTASSSATITPRTVTAVVNIASRIYDGTNQATISGEALAGAVAGDLVSLTGGTASFPGRDVETATVTITGLSLTGADSGNYTLASSTTTASASILPKPINGSITAASKTYDGTTNASLADRSLFGVLAGDAVTMAGGTASFSSNDIGFGKMVTASGFALAGDQADDYSLANPTETAMADILPMTISGTVFNDANIDGAMGDGELGIAGRTVDLQIAGKGTKGQKVAKTDANGNFSFTNVPAGSYVVKVATTTGWHFTNIAASGSPLALQAGTSVTGLTFGETNSSTVSGVVFLDANHDGKRKSVESPLTGWTVNLDGVVNGVHLTAISNANGSYTFTAVPTGAYRVSVVPQDGYINSTKGNASLGVTLNASKVVANLNLGEILISAMAAVKSKRIRRN